MTDPVNDETQAWLDKARELLKDSKAKKGLRKGLDSEVKALHAVLIELKATSSVRHARHTQKCHAVAEQALKAARLTNEAEFKAAFQPAQAELHKLVQTLKDEIKAQKDLGVEVSKFAVEYGKVEITVAETSGLRGARTAGTPVHTHLSVASGFMQTAIAKRDQAQAQASDALMKEAMASLQLAKSKLAEAKQDTKSVNQSTQDYLAAVKAWGVLQPKARDALRQMRELPGAETLADTLQADLGTAVGGIKNVDGVFVGHDLAVKLLGDIDARLPKARKAQAEHGAKTLPKLVATASAAVDTVIVAYDLLVPTYLAKAVRDEAKALTESGRHDRNAAVNGLAALSTRLTRETTDLHVDKAAAEAAATLYDTTVASLAALKVPPGLYAGLKLAGDTAKTGEFADRQWTVATTRLKNATTGLQQIETRYKTLGPDWVTRRSELQGIRKEAAALMVFPAVSAEANRLRVAADDVLKQFVGGDLQAAINAANNARLDKRTLAAAREVLNRQAEAKGVPVGDGKGKPLDDTTRLAFVQGRSDLIELVREGSTAADAALIEHLQANKTLEQGPRRLLRDHWKSLIGKIQADWNAAEQASNGDLKALEQQAKAAVAALERLVKEQTKLKPKELEATLKTLQQDDAKAFEASKPGWIEKLIAELERSGQDVSKERQALSAILALPQPGAQIDTLAQAVSKKLDARQKAFADKQLKSRDSLAQQVDVPLKKLPVSKVYREELRKESQDTLAMINTNDPDLLLAAQARLTKQAELIASIAAQPDLYENNTKALKELASRLAKMTEVLPDTFRLLQTELTRLFVDTKHTAPTAMAAIIAKFDKRVAEKEVELAARKQAIKDLYDPLKAQIEALWKKRSEVIGDTLGIGSGFFPKEFEAYKDARLAEAKALRGTEAAIASVIKPLHELKDKLDAIEAAPNKKAAVEALNADEVAKQRQVRDMAAQFEREIKAFKEGTLVQAQAAAKADDDGDSDLAGSLSGVASAAGKLVGPYLKLLGTWPHEKMGAQPSPDMERMKKDFERARAMLAEAERTARRLIDTPSTTNVTAPSKDGLRKLLPKWSERCLAYAAAVRTMAAAIRSAAAGEGDAEVRQSAEKAAKLVEGAGGTFRADAFSASFAGLMEALPEDQAGREKGERSHKARREDALRVMREYRTELTENALRRLLTDVQQNPFDAATLLAAAGALRVTLKEIELQVLDSA